MARRALEKNLGADPEIEVVGTATNGKEAMGLIGSLRPDVVTCDMEMPEMDGVQTLMALRKDYPNVKVIILSSLTQADSPQQVLCRNLGAHAVLAKPAEHSDIRAANRSDEIMAAIKQLA